MSQKVIILRGLPASGKSTWAREQVRSDPKEKTKRINKDDLRSMIDDGQFSRLREAAILDARDLLLRRFLNCGHNVIIDDTNFDPKHEQQIRTIAEGVCPVEVEVKTFEVSLDEALARNAQRPEAERVPPHVIKSMHRKWCQKPQHNYAEQDVTLPRCYIFDIDGTLACQDDREPYDHAKADGDKVNLPVARLLHVIRDAEPASRLIFLSGRDSKFRDLTLFWLQRNKLHVLNYDQLFMRPEDDKRCDAIVKQELYETHVKGKYYVAGIFDDRNRVVKMWRELGLPCFQVADGDF